MAKLGVLEQHHKRLAEEADYRDAALTAPSITDKTGISSKWLGRTAPTAYAEATVDTGLADLSREDLDERAVTAGVSDPGKLPNKQAVIDAIEAG